MTNVPLLHPRYTVSKTNNGKPMLDAAQAEGKIVELAALHESVKADLEAKLNRQSLMLATALKEKNDALTRIATLEGRAAELMARLKKLEPPAPKFQKGQIVVRLVDDTKRTLPYAWSCKIDDLIFLSAKSPDHGIVFTKPGWYYKSYGWGYCHEGNFRAQTKEEQGPMDSTATIPGDTK